jgi:hypothetical protein
MATSKLAQLALDSSLPQAWAEELVNSDRVTLDAAEFSKLTFKVWDVYQDTPGEFQLKVQLQGVCDDTYNLVDKPEDLSTIKSLPGYFSVSGYILVCDDEIPDTVIAAMERFAVWTEENIGVKNPEGIPSLWVKASSDAIMQLVIEPYTNSKGVEIFAFNGWAHQGLHWAGDGVTTKPVTKRFTLTQPVNAAGGTTAPPVAPPVAPPAFTPPKVRELTR